MRINILDGSTAFRSLVTGLAVFVGALAVLKEGRGELGLDLGRHIEGRWHRCLRCRIVVEQTEHGGVVVVVIG